MKGTAHIDIDRPRAEVFAFMADDSNLEKCVPMLVDHGIIEETPEKVGTRFWHEYEEKGRRFRMTGVVTEHAPPERMGVELDGPFFGLKVDYEFEELTPDSTRVIQHSESNFKHVFKLIGLFMGKKMQCEGEKVQMENFERMKAFIEAKGAEADAAAAGADS